LPLLDDQLGKLRTKMTKSKKQSTTSTESDPELQLTEVIELLNKLDNQQLVKIIKRSLAQIMSGIQLKTQ